MVRDHPQSLLRSASTCTTVRQNELIAYFLGLGVLPLGSAGLILAAVLAATMSTFAGSLMHQPPPAPSISTCRFKPRNQPSRKPLGHANVHPLCLADCKCSRMVAAYNTPKQTIVEIVARDRILHHRHRPGPLLLGLTRRKFHPVWRDRSRHHLCADGRAAVSSNGLFNPQPQLATFPDRGHLVRLAELNLHVHHRLARRLDLNRQEGGTADR